MSVILDSSAVLAVINGEPGSDMVNEAMLGSTISASNYSEVIAKLMDKGLGDGGAIDVLDAFPITVHPVDLAQARRAGFLRRPTRRHGLSLGDRACLALAAEKELPVMTADRAWAELDLGVEVVLIR